MIDPSAHREAARTVRDRGISSGVAFPLDPDDDEIAGPYAGQRNGGSTRRIVLDGIEGHLLINHKVGVYGAIRC